MSLSTPQLFQLLPEVRPPTATKVPPTATRVPPSSSPSSTIIKTQSISQCPAGTTLSNNKCGKPKSCPVGYNTEGNNCTISPTIFCPPLTILEKNSCYKCPNNILPVLKDNIITCNIGTPINNKCSSGVLNTPSNTCVLSIKI